MLDALSLRLSLPPRDQWSARAAAWIGARSLRRIILAFTAGVILSRAFAPLSWWPVIFLSVPVAVLLIDSAPGWRSAFGRGWWFGFGFFVAGLNWIAISFSQQSNVPVAVAPFAIAGLSAFLALYIGAAFAVAKRAWHRGPWRIVILAASWTVMEGLRAVLLTGFPWNSVGTLWADHVWTAQGAWLVSMYGLSFLTIWLGASPVLLGEGKLRFDRLVPALASVMIMTSITAWGGARLQQNPTQLHSDLQLRLVQANVKQRDKWIPALIEDHFDNHLDLSRGANPDGTAKGVDLLIWPEATVQRTSFDREGSIHRWRLSRVLDGGALALVGGPRVSDPPLGSPNDWQLYNSFFAIDRAGTILARYDKQHLVPFGEYLPLKSLLSKLGLGQLTGGRGFAAGTGAPAIHIDGVPPFRVLICYETIFPGQVMDDGGEAQWLLNITNDGWFGVSEGPYQHFAQARMRAVEEGVPLVRSAGGGISAIIDPVGRVLASLDLDRRGTLSGYLPKALERDSQRITTKTRIIIILSISILVLIAALLKRKTLKTQNNK